VPRETIEVDRQGSGPVEITLNVPGRPNIVRVGGSEFDTDEIVRLELTGRRLLIERRTAEKSQIADVRQGQPG